MMSKLEEGESQPRRISSTPNKFLSSRSYKGKKRRFGGHPLKSEWIDHAAKHTLRRFISPTSVKLDMSATSRHSREKYLKQLDNEGYFKLSSKLRCCGKQYISLYCTNNRRHVLKLPYRCNLRICEHEEGRRYARIKPMLDYLKSEHGYYKMLTLTTGKKVESIEQYNEWRKALVKFYHRIESKIDGAVMTTEFTKRGYIHFHFFIKGKRYISSSWISQTWKEYTGAYIIKINKARNKTAANYILKYMIKAPNWNVTELSVGHLLTVLHGKRLLTTYGCYYGLDFNGKKEPCFCVFCYSRTGLKHNMEFGGMSIEEGVDKNGT